MTRNVYRSLCALVAVLLLSGFAIANDARNSSGVTIKNFGRMDERFYRGAQPKEDEYGQLSALGIKTVVDLQEKPKGYEKRAVEALGMRYVNIPMVDKAYPKDEWVAEFLRVVNDSATGKFYVHCAGGRHRTGTMGAIYRFTQYHWTFDQAYKEMKDYDFYTSWGHGDFKDYLEAYWTRIQNQGYPDKLGVFDARTNAETAANIVTTIPSPKK
jgi:protein tyrosine phosphatase (PTP) superfamily phosphohydrolase (DUF442 family)